MINGLGVLGWGVGGIEAEAAMLGQPVSMLIPQVVGFRLTGELPEGATATDLVLTVTQMLRKKGVVGKFVEFYGPGLAHAAARRPRDDRQHGARVRRDLRHSSRSTRETLDYLRFTGRAPEQIALVEAYPKEQGLFHTPATPEAAYSDTLGARSRHRRAVARRAAAAAGPRAARAACKASFLAELPGAPGRQGGRAQAARRDGRPLGGRGRRRRGRREATADRDRDRDRRRAVHARATARW